MNQQICLNSLIFFSSNVEMFFLAFTVLSSAYYVNYLEIKM